MKTHSTPFSEHLRVTSSLGPSFWSSLPRSSSRRAASRRVFHSLRLNPNVITFFNSIFLTSFYIIIILYSIELSTTFFIFLRKSLRVLCFQKCQALRLFSTQQACLRLNSSSWVIFLWMLFFIAPTSFTIIV